MPSSLPQVSFTSGELAPSLYGRVDFNRYYTGLRSCRNFIVRPFGGIVNRPGTRFISEVQNSDYRHRLIPFQFSTAQTYALLFGQYTMRVIKDGAMVLYPSGHASAGQPVEIVTPYPASALNRLKYTQSADVMTICHPSYPPQQLSRTDHHLWSFAAFANENGPFQEINTDQSISVYASAVTGAVTVTSNVNLFTSAHVGMMLYLEQSPDSLTAVWEVDKSVKVNTVRRAGVHYYKAVNNETTGTVKPDHTEGISYDGNDSVAWDYLHSGFGIVLITGYTSAKVVTGTVLKRLPDQVMTASASKTITTLTPSSGGNVKVTIAAHGYADGVAVTVSGVTGTTGANGTWIITVLDADNFELTGCTDTTAWAGGGSVLLALSALPTYKWAFEAWGGDQGYPGCVSYYQQRQVFGGATDSPQTTWMSRTKGYRDFGVGNPILDDDALDFTVASNEVNEIRHFVELSELVLLTSGGPWLVKGSQDGVLIPSAISVKRQSIGGASHVQPVIVGNQALYVLDKGKAIRSLGYVFSSDQFNGADLTIASNHLFTGRTVEEWAYQCEPLGAVWCVRDDGTLLCLTYMPEHEVVGWSRHDTDGLFESVCSISEGDEDAVYVVVLREINGQSVRYVERLASRFDTDYRNAFFVDSGLTYDGRNGTDESIVISGGTDWAYGETLTLTASAALFSSSSVGDEIQFRDEANGIVYRLRITGYVSPTAAQAQPNRTIPEAYRNTARADWEFARDSFLGLDHLEGETVAVLADGIVQESRVVVAGSITLERPAAVVHAGLPIESDMETLDISVTGQSIREKRKRINHVSFVLDESTALWAGPDADHLTEYRTRFDENYDMPGTVFSGVTDIRIQGTWSTTGRVFVRHSVPLPISVLGVIPEVELGGS